MTTARQIITSALTFRLNRLSVGETADGETLAVCLTALNEIVDEFNGGQLSLFREILTTSTAITGASGTLGTHWALSPGVTILGATYKEGGEDEPMQEMTIAQYAETRDKDASSSPFAYAHDGLATVYFWPALAATQVTLRTRAEVGEFATVDTDVQMPNGYKAWLAALLAEKLAPTMVGGISPAVLREANMARMKMRSKNAEPAIICGGFRGNILSGWE